MALHASGLATEPFGGEICLAWLGMARYGGWDAVMYQTGMERAQVHREDRIAGVERLDNGVDRGWLQR